MNIRLYKATDFECCLNTFIDVFNKAPWHDEWTKQTAYQYLRDFINTPGFKAVVVYDDKKLIGFVFGHIKHWWQGNEFFIQEMCVLQEQQNKGIGSKLMDYMLQSLKIDDVVTVSLLTDRGIPAENFYKKSGFEEIERLVFYSKDV